MALKSIIGDAIEEFFIKNLSKMRSDIMHPYLGVRMNAYIDTVSYIQQNMKEAIVCKDRNDIITKSLKSSKSEGLVLELGVYKGATINHIASVLNNIGRKDKIIYGFDSFEGLAEDWKGTRTRKFQLKLFKKPKFKNKIKIIEGWFKDSLPIFVEGLNESISFLHIDCDIYESTRDVFANLAEKIEKGTIIVFDEYFNYPFWQNHEYKAFKEFVDEYSVEYKYLFYAHSQVAVVITNITHKNSYK